jgi:hypothetical protein
MRLFGLRDGVVSLFGATAEAIEYDEKNRRGFHA